MSDCFWRNLVLGAASGRDGRQITLIKGRNAAGRGGCTLGVIDEVVARRLISVCVYYFMSRVHRTRMGIEKPTHVGLVICY